MPCHTRYINHSPFWVKTKIVDLSQEKMALSNALRSLNVQYRKCRVLCQKVIQLLVELLSVDESHIVLDDLEASGIGCKCRTYSDPA